MIPINVILPKTPTMMEMVVLDIRRSFTSGEGVVDEIGRKPMEVDEIGRKLMEVDEISSEVKVGFLHETPATSTCLTMSLPSFKERSSKEHSTSLSSDPVQTTPERCTVLSGLP